MQYIKRNKTIIKPGANMRKTSIFLFFLCLTSPLLSKQNTFSAQELTKRINATIANYAEETSMEPIMLAKLTQKAKDMIQQLDPYDVTGFSFAPDPNFALIFDHQDPTFDIIFKNKNGEIKQRKHKLEIDSIGFKFELALKLNFMFFVNTNLDFHSSNKVLPLGRGASLNIAPCFIGGAYMDLQDIPGGIFMFSINLGISAGISLITGGKIYPAQ